MSAKKIGRPIIGKEPLTHDMKFRVDNELHDKIIEYGENHNMKAAEVIRKAIIEFFRTK